MGSALTKSGTARNSRKSPSFEPEFAVFHEKLTGEFGAELKADR